MKISDYIAILERQNSNLNRLLSLAIEKREATIKMESKKVQEIVAKEERALLGVNSAEQERLQFQNNLLQTNNLSVENTQIITFIKAIKKLLNENEIKSIIKLQDEMKKIIKEIHKINENNLYLTEHSINFIKKTVDTILGDKNKSILDRRI